MWTPTQDLNTRAPLPPTPEIKLFATFGLALKHLTLHESNPSVHPSQLATTTARWRLASMNAGSGTPIDEIYWW